MVLLVVEDHAALRKAIVDALGSEWRVLDAEDLMSARSILAENAIDTILLDVALPDGSAFDFLDSIAALAPRPVVVAMSGAATPEESFRLAQRGVRHFLPKPLDLDGLQTTLHRISDEAPDLEPHLRNVVGHRGIHDVEREVRSVMVEEAVARAGGNRRGAAKLLSISRQLLQHILRRAE